MSTTIPRNAAVSARDSRCRPGAGARAAGGVGAARGTSEYTLETIQRLLTTTRQDLSASEVAERVGVSCATAQRYLSHLHEAGRVSVRLRYGASGPPEHRYHWSRGAVGA